MIKPQGKRILVRPLRTPAKIGLIFIPETSRVNLLSGKVIAVSDAIDWARPGDLVIFNSHSGLLVDKKENLLMLVDEDVLGLIEKEDVADVCE